jgi:hypothetical protein
VCEVGFDGATESLIVIDDGTPVTGDLTGGTFTISTVPDSGSRATFEFTEALAVSRAITSEERTLLYTWMSTYMNGA